jgi:1-acyl-sn-glycerol-3-phosphate acyltransferase
MFRRVLGSTLFFAWFLLISVPMYVLALPLLAGPRIWLREVMRFWARAMLFGLKWLAGVRHEIRGREHIPPGAALVAAKHYSMWETIAVMEWLQDPAVVIKRELFRVPFYGWYIRASGMIAVDRDAGGRALREMARDAKRAFAERRQVVIFPEGTRRRLGDPPDYKPGIAALYAQLDVPCVPVAHNSGLHWRGFWKIPGTVVVQFLPAIPAGLRREAFMRELETRIERAVRSLVSAP